MLGALFAAGIAAVYVLSLRIGPAPAAGEPLADQAQVDTTMARLAVVQQNNTVRVDENFCLDARRRQVPIRQLNGNPFVFRLVQDSRSKRKTDGQATPRQDPQARRRSEALAAVSKLRLQSVMVGANETVAVISNNLLTRGQCIEGWTIERIEPHQVLLRWQDVTHVLRMME